MIVEFLKWLDVSALYTALVWIGTALTVVWLSFQWKEPESRHLPSWQYWGRRLGVSLMQGGMFCTVLFGTAAEWVPWPPMVLVALGMDIKIGLDVIVSYRRCKVYQGFVDASAMGR